MALTKVEWQRPTQAVVVRRRPLGLNASPFDASAAEPSLLGPKGSTRPHSESAGLSLDFRGETKRERERAEKRESSGAGRRWLWNPSKRNTAAERNKKKCLASAFLFTF